MSESIFVAAQIYLYAFVISLGIAGLIRGMLWTIHRFSPKENQPEAEASNE